MRPDIGGARPAPKPSAGRETLPCSRPPKGEARTGPRVVEDRKPPATIPTALPGKPCPAPTADPSPPPPPGWFATAGMHYTNKIPLLHTPRRHQGDDDDLKKISRLQTPTAYTRTSTAEARPRELPRGHRTTSSRIAAGQPPWSLEPEDETRQCPVGTGLGLTAPHAAAHYRRARRRGGSRCGHALQRRQPPAPAPPQTAAECPE